MNEKQVRDAWNRRKSIKGTARELGVSHGVVKKHLIALGIYKTPLTERIAKLYAAGMPPSDIAEHLGISSTTVCCNMPYIKTSYLDKNKTVNAMRIKKCREKKRAAIAETKES